MQRTITSARTWGGAGSAGSGWRRSALAGLAAAVSVLLGAAAGARAQVVRDIEEPQYVVVEQDNLQLKAGPGGVHYGVTVLRDGQVLHVDGRTAEGVTPAFLRVVYPPGMSAFVKADEAVAEGSTLRLTTPSRLRALNSSGGERGHWWFLLPEDRVLPAGTVLPLADTLESEGRVYGYRVPAPAEARGFVLEDKTRPATPEEVEQYKRALADPAAPTGEPAAQPAPAATDEPPAGQPAEQPADQPAATPEQPEAEPEPAAPEPAPVPAPVDEPVQTPAPSDPAAEPRSPEAPEGIEPGAARTVRSGEPASLETLQSLYQQAQSQPIREAELDEVMAEFQRTIESLKGREEEQRTREFLGARLELLRLRADLQKSMRAAERLADVSGERRERFERDSAALDRARAYTVVGRLTPSTVYDGRRLPKMYRIQSVDEGFARTVAYLMPSEKLELDAKLGRVVGIVGETSLDPALRVNIIRPRRVDVLNPARSGEPAPAEAAPAPAPASTAAVPTDRDGAAAPR